MRWFLLLILSVAVAACSKSPTGPSGTSGTAGPQVDIAGTWTGTFASSNNFTEQISMDLRQSSSNVTGTWRGDEVAWTGNVTGTVSGSTFSGQMTFNGTAFNETVCTGTANVSGPASSGALTWTSGTGVVGGSCPAPLPVGITLTLSR